MQFVYLTLQTTGYNDTLDGTIYNYVLLLLGDTLTRCSSDNIEWKAGATSGVYDIEWSIDIPTGMTNDG